MGVKERKTLSNGTKGVKNDTVGGEMSEYISQMRRSAIFISFPFFYAVIVMDSKREIVLLEIGIDHVCDLK